VQLLHQGPHNLILFYILFYCVYIQNKTKRVGETFQAVMSVDKIATKVTSFTVVEL